MAYTVDQIIQNLEKKIQEKYGLQGQELTKLKQMLDNDDPKSPGIKQLIYLTYEIDSSYYLAISSALLIDWLTQILQNSSEFIPLIPCMLFLFSFFGYNQLFKDEGKNISSFIKMVYPEFSDNWCKIQLTIINNFLENENDSKDQLFTALEKTRKDIIQSCQSAFSYITLFAHNLGFFFPNFLSLFLPTQTSNYGPLNNTLAFFSTTFARNTVMSILSSYEFSKKQEGNLRR